MQGIYSCIYAESQLSGQKVCIYDNLTTLLRGNQDQGQQHVKGR